MKDFEIYALGLIYASICSSLNIEEITKRLDDENPTGLDHGWTLSKENFVTGEKNPHPCNQHPETHKHYLFSC